MIKPVELDAAQEELQKFLDTGPLQSRKYHVGTGYGFDGDDRDAKWRLYVYTDEANAVNVIMKAGRGFPVALRDIPEAL